MRDFHWFGIPFSHVYIEVHFLQFEVPRLPHEHFPHILRFGFAEERFLCLQHSGIVTYFYVNDAFKHILKRQQLSLSSLLLLPCQLLHNFVVQLPFLLFFRYLCSAQWASFIDQQTLTKTLFTKNMFAVCLYWVEILFMTN